MLIKDINFSMITLLVTLLGSFKVAVPNAGLGT
jgi:hypothetical protein